MAFLSSISQCTMPSKSHQTQIMVFLGWRSGLTLGFGISPGATHGFLSLIHIYIQAPFLISCDDSIQKALFVTVCCSMAGKMLRSNLKVIFFVKIHFFGLFTTCLVTFLLQKCFEMVFIKFRRSFSAGRVVDVKIAIFELCKPFSCCRFDHDTFLIYHANIPGCFSSFLTSMKSKE